MDIQAVYPNLAGLLLLAGFSCSEILGAGYLNPVFGGNQYPPMHPHIANT